jgi:hypothetical protein
MRATILAALLLCSTLVLGGFHVDNFYVGNEMMERCDRTNTGELKTNIPRYNACIAFLGGVIDATATWQVWGKITSKALCVPKGVTGEEAREVFLAFMQRYPEKWHQGAASLALNAFEIAWPCKKE